MHSLKQSGYCAVMASSDLSSSEEYKRLCAELAELYIKRRSIKGRITKFSNYLKTLCDLECLSTKTYSEVCTKLEKFKDMFSVFDELQSRIEVLNESNLDTELNDRDEIENTFHKCISNAKIILGTVETPNSNPEQPSPNSSSHCFQGCASQDQGFRLPVIKIPNFDGTYYKWLEFRDTFESLIHVNNKIKAIHKFHYLCSYLEGEAARVVSNLEISDKNYSEAWGLLCERYNNTRTLVNNHLNSLFKVDSIVRESDKSLRFLVDHVTKNLRALQNLGQPTEHWDTLIVHIISSKLDPSTSLKWEEHRNNLPNSEMPTLIEFHKFLRSRADVLESVQRARQDRSNPTPNNNTSNKFYRFNKPSVIAASPVHSTNRGIMNCFCCEGDHRIYDCPSFASKSAEERIMRATDLKLCLNCLRSGHTTQSCRLSSCRICNKRHNTLLHKPEQLMITAGSSTDTENTTDIPITSNTSENPSSISMSVSSTSQVVLSTALVDIVNPANKQVETVKVLLDCGSMSSFITNNLRQRLQLDTLALNATTIVGIGNSSLRVTPERCTVTIQSRCSPFSAILSCLVLPEITDTIPKYPIDIKHINIPSDIILADPNFHIPGEIEMLIGADLFWDILGPQRRYLGDKLPRLQNSKLGWLIAGPIRTNDKVTNSNASIQCNFSALESLHDKLSRFWELEELPNKPEPSQTMIEAEHPCEKHFISHTTRLESGRFSVRLPLMDTPDCLGDSYYIARKRFLNLEKRFERQPNLKKMYSDFMREYEDLGHMSKSNIPRPPLSYFVPHHAVMREKSESTKLRVVYDASCRTSSGLSINDIQMVGPNIQDSLFNILLRFRQHMYVLSGDIEKMYRQTAISEPDRDLQLILWRDDPNSPLNTYRLNTVTYGFASASYLSTRCIWQLGEECHDDNIKTVMQRDMYIDDLLTGSQTEDELMYIQDSVSRALESGCFNLRKFRSNSRTVLEKTAISSQNILSLSQSCDTLGLNWNPSADTLQFPISIQIKDPKVITKRNILSQTFQIFDPLGLLSPCTIKPKLIMQKLWADKVGWDTQVPADIERGWKRFTDNLVHITSISIPRNVIRDLPVSVELHTFGDASQSAYGACVYIKSIDQAGNVSVNLYCAKARVAPSKQALTIPRLELSGALLAAQLSNAVSKALRRQISSKFFWTDSSVVLGWLAAEPSRLKLWVANRVGCIHELSDSSTWRYVPTAQNPADLASRGVDPHQIKDSSLWWLGPPFLYKSQEYWPTLNSHHIDELPEVKVHTTIIAEPVKSCINIMKYSNLNFLQRMTAYMCRFIHNCKNTKDRRVGPLSVDELDMAFSRLAKISQQESFPLELNECLNQGKLKPKSIVASLNPFLDSQGLLRVGGRLSNTKYDYDKKHPILLHSKHHFTKILFIQEHNRLLHAGPQMLLSSIRERVWPLGGRDLARRTARSCIKCQRISARTLENIMGNLPSQRLTPDFPFSTVAADFGGPFMITDRKGRGCKITKAYLCLFICFRSKCVHLEAVSELSRDAFTLTLRRFISRRGKPKEIFCDNGRNFVATAKEISNFLQANSDFIIADAGNQNIKFKFSPAYAPNFNGLVEAGIKSAKFHLKRILGTSHLTFEELSSLFAQIEAILNSRPLCPLSSSPNDFTPLTPGHFLIGRPLTSLPSPSLEDYKVSRLDRYQRIEQARQHFWRRWQSEYITELQSRLKWRVRCRDLQPNDVVLLKEDNTAPLHWRLGRVERLFPGADGVPRVADVVTARGVVRRAISKMVLLKPNAFNGAEDVNATAPA